MIWTDLVQISPSWSLNILLAQTETELTPSGFWPVLRRLRKTSDNTQTVSLFVSKLRIQSLSEALKFLF